jgi:SRSO17 transposase
MNDGLEMEIEEQRERLLKEMDKRNMIVIYIDDIPDEKRGEKVAGAEPQYNGCAGKVTRSVVYVSSMIKAGDLEFYSRSKKYIPLKRFKGNTRYFEKKTEIARDLLSKDVEDIRKLDVKKRIVTCTDCGYANKEMVDFSRGLGTFYILGIKGNTAIALKRKNKSVSDYFLDKKLKKRTIDEKEVYFTEANLNLKNFGQQRIFMIKTSKNAKMKFFITNIRKSKPETIIRISKRRWDDEQGHKL